MIKNLIIKALQREIEKIENYKINYEEPYSDGFIDGLEKAIKIAERVFE
jgi:hypothetical protein